MTRTLIMLIEIGSIPQIRTMIMQGYTLYNPLIARIEVQILFRNDIPHNLQLFGIAKPF